MTPSTIENTEAANPDEELRQGLFAAQAVRIVELQAEIASRQEEVDELKARILDSHPAGTYQAGNLKVQVKPGARRLMNAELSSLGIALIVESAIADYDLHDEDGNELTDDLYVIRSERLDELGLTVARRIHKAIRELEAQGKTGFPVHSMLCGHTPPTITTADDGTYTLRFDNASEAVAVKGLNKTALADVKKTINDFLKEVKTHERHE